MLNRRRLFMDLQRGICVWLNGVRGVLYYNGDTSVRFSPNNSPESSYFRLPRPALIDYDGSTIRLHKAGYREMNLSEKELYREWLQLQSISIVDKMAFFKEHRKSYLVGLGMIGGKSLDRKRWSDGIAECILDDSIRGELDCEFIVDYVR